MDLNKLQNLMMLEFSAENLRIQLDLEDTVNSPNTPNNASFKIAQIKQQLEKLVLNELVATKFQSLFTTPNNKDVPKQQENG